MKDIQIGSDSGLKQPRIFMSAPSMECSDMWYEGEFVSCWESLSEGHPFFTEIVSTVTQRFFFRDLIMFAVRVNIFDSNEDMLRFLNTIDQERVVDTCYVKL